MLAFRSNQRLLRGPSVKGANDPLRISDDVPRKALFLFAKCEHRVLDGPTSGEKGFKGRN